MLGKSVIILLFGFLLIGCGSGGESGAQSDNSPSTPEGTPEPQPDDDNPLDDPTPDDPAPEDEDRVFSDETLVNIVGIKKPVRPTIKRVDFSGRSFLVQAEDFSSITFNEDGSGELTTFSAGIKKMNWQLLGNSLKILEEGQNGDAWSRTFAFNKETSGSLQFMYVGSRKASQSVIPSINNRLSEFGSVSLLPE